MLQMFRSRGTAARDNSNVSPSLAQSSSSSGGASANTRNSPSTSIAAGPARPLRLVYLDAKGKFVMDPEAVATLQLVKGPVGVVSVCGRARQGKSFILNQLLGRNNGFQVASTHKPCTKGLWMWSAPLKRTAIDGTEYNLVLLDSEGIDAYDQTHTDILIGPFVVQYVYLQPDETALDRLSLVTEMTKHIRVRASGGRASVTELGQFSPIFVWLLRDFYLSLAEDDGRRITPRDYLELALRSVQGGQELVAKNEIRESIRALFPDRECFTLVRPLADENALQKLDQIPLDKLRPEFRSGLDALTKFVFERTRPKQVGATIMTGSLFVGITQSFLDAINSGAVPTISSSWQSVEEAECRRAYELAAEAYMSSFDRSKPPEEDLLRASHEDATKKSLAAFGSSAVGVGLTRQKYENQLHDFLRKAFEVFVLTVLAILPLLPSRFSIKAYKLCLLGTAISSGYSLYSLYGKPRAWNSQTLQVWFQSVVSAKDFIYLLYCLVFVSSQTLLKFSLLPVLCQATQHIAKFLRRSFNHSNIYRKYLDEVWHWVESNTRLSILSSNAEIAIGFLLIIALFSSQRNIIQAFMYWQLLKLMYHAPATAGYHQSVWAKLGRTLNPAIDRYAPLLKAPLAAAQRWWFRQ